MNDTVIITSYVIIDDRMCSLNHRSHCLAHVTDAEVLTVAVVAAKYFHNNHERALWVMSRLGYLSGRLSTSRFNRRLHALCDWLPLTVETLGELFAGGAVFIIDRCRCRSAAGRGRAGIARCAGAPIAVMVRPNGKSSSASGCLWSALRRASRSALRWSRAVITI